VVGARRVDDPPVLLVTGLELLDKAGLLDLGAETREHILAAEESLDELARDALLDLDHGGDFTEALAIRGGAGGAPSAGRSRAAGGRSGTRRSARARPEATRE